MGGFGLRLDTALVGHRGRPHMVFHLLQSWDNGVTLCEKEVA